MYNKYYLIKVIFLGLFLKAVSRPFGTPPDGITSPLSLKGLFKNVFRTSCATNQDLFGLCFLEPNLYCRLQDSSLKSSISWNEFCHLNFTFVKICHFFLSFWHRYLFFQVVMYTYLWATYLDFKDIYNYYHLGKFFYQNELKVWITRKTRWKSIK